MAFRLNTIVEAEAIMWGLRLYLFLNVAHHEVVHCWINCFHSMFHRSKIAYRSSEKPAPFPLVQGSADLGGRKLDNACNADTW